MKSIKIGISFYFEWLKNSVMILGFFALGYCTALAFQNVHYFFRGTVELMTLWIIVAMFVGFIATYRMNRRK